RYSRTDPGGINQQPAPAGATAADLKACPAGPSPQLVRPKLCIEKASSVPGRSLASYTSQRALRIPIYALAASRSAFTGSTISGNQTVGMNVPEKQLASEVLIDLHRRLSVLPSRSHERRMIMQETAHLYGISEQTLYRALAQRARPKAFAPLVRRSLYPDSINRCASQHVKIL